MEIPERRIAGSPAPQPGRPRLVPADHAPSLGGVTGRGRGVSAGPEETLQRQANHCEVRTRRESWGFESGEWEEKQYFGKRPFLADFGGQEGGWKVGKVLGVLAE